MTRATATTRLFTALAALAFTSAATPTMAQDDAAPADGPGFTIGAHHVGISVPDLDASIAWYGEMLGFELVRKMYKPEDPEMNFALITNGAFNIELFEVVEDREMPEYRFDPTADLYVNGVKHLAFEVDDAEAATAELVAKGVTVLLGPVVTERTTYVFFADNSGIPFELIEFK